MHLFGEAAEYVRISVINILNMLFFGFDTPSVARLFTLMAAVVSALCMLRRISCSCHLSCGASGQAFA